jgi:hypothetical protein
VLAPVKVVPPWTGPALRRNMAAIGKHGQARSAKSKCPRFQGNPGPTRTSDHEEDTTLIIGTFTYAGTGWRTTGDALLANTAADQARKRRQAGHDALTDEYNAPSTGRQAA